ncbi:GFA family protein [uncultured Nitratireductor sp.]|uniref:GFA family protein n=1 Tax=uncultured Nitratireductor sp. TaxID=520953 RepID=UPI0034591663
MVICHCRSCQQSLGSGVNFQLLWAADRFPVTKGTPTVYRHACGSGKSLDRRFCAKCGSAFWLIGEALPSGIVIAGVEAFNEHRRSPDGTINPGRIHADH